MATLINDTIINSATSNETLSGGSSITAALKAFFPDLTGSDLAQFNQTYSLSDFESINEQFRTATGESELRCAVSSSNVNEQSMCLICSAIGRNYGRFILQRSANIRLQIQYRKSHRWQSLRGARGRELDDVSGDQYWVRVTTHHIALLIS